LSDPDHAVLHGQGNEVLDGGELIAAGASRDGKAASDLVFPGRRKPPLGGLVGNFLKLPRGHAHIGRGAEYDGVSRIKRGPIGLSYAAFSADGYDLSLGTLGHKLRHPLGVAIARVINNNRFRHDVSFEGS
jgi:hypothetical protein